MDCIIIDNKKYELELDFSEIPECDYDNLVELIDNYYELWTAGEEDKLEPNAYVYIHFPFGDDAQIMLINKESGRSDVIDIIEESEVKQTIRRAKLKKILM